MSVAISDSCPKSNTITMGSTWLAVWQLSWPMLLNMMVLAASNLFEGWVAGQLGSAAQAALGIGSQLWYFIIMLTLALSAGTTAVISQYWGARDFQQAGIAARQAIFLSIVFGLVATSVGLFFTRQLIHAFQAAPQVEEEAVRYLFFTTLSMLPSTVLWISNAVFRATGDSRTPMNTMVAVTTITIALDYLLCLTAEQGIAGIGMSWIIACSAGVAINYFQLKDSPLKICLDIPAAIAEFPSSNFARRFLQIGLPACVQDVAILISSCGLFAILSHTPQPTASQAAWAAGWRVEEVLTLMPMYALNMAAATLVGQNVGARNWQRALRCGYQVTVFGAAINLVIGIAVVACAPTIAGWICSDLPTQQLCSSYLRIVGASEPFFATWLILSGAMQGAAYTRPPMTITVTCFVAIRLFLAWLAVFPLNLPVSAIWGIMAATSCLAALMMLKTWHQRLWQA